MTELGEWGGEGHSPNLISGARQTPGLTPYCSGLWARAAL